MSDCLATQTKLYYSDVQKPQISEAFSTHVSQSAQTVNGERSLALHKRCRQLKHVILIHTLKIDPNWPPSAQPVLPSMESELRDFSSALGREQSRVGLGRPEGEAASHPSEMAPLTHSRAAPTRPTGEQGPFFLFLSFHVPVRFSFPLPFPFPLNRSSALVRGLVVRTEKTEGRKEWLCLENQSPSL